ncbi:hypothetical protein GH714_012907 [Hevea brasiliensis]|uniref:Protein FAR1-RELATED SEQUENCE n=1 Tax=Hevea brasiliensis TaxID=3981 RepID=A0A6A6LA60_HEVBR|nr:hypothetical protein GH714_012907 [Hevea brasiliensis]
MNTDLNMEDRNESYCKMVMDELFGGSGDDSGDNNKAKDRGSNEQIKEVKFDGNNVVTNLASFEEGPQLVMKDNRMWKMKTICSSHNHDLDPATSMFMVGHRNITPSMKRVLKANDICEIRPCKSIKMLEVQASGLENLSHMSKDCLS